MIDITAITATIPERAGLLHELRQSIATQTMRPPWLVRTDSARRGPAQVLNELVAETDTGWVFRCDDDDLFDPDHFAVISEHLTADYDIVYTWPRCVPAGHLGDERALQRVYPLKTLMDANWITSAAAVRVSLWEQLGGLRDTRNEDHDFWKRAYLAGARFRCIPKVTWTYRLGDWPHRCLENE